MKKISIGIMAHVDAGKTTLSESMLYNAGTIRKLGRVDTKDAFLDTDEMEKDRGITIFSKQALFKWKDTEFTLLDTPGHVDFVAETERVLGVIDYAILLISAADGVTAHTETLFRLLSDYDVPAFIFINKMDYANADKNDLLDQLKKSFGPGCVSFEGVGEAVGEKAGEIAGKTAGEKAGETAGKTSGEKAGETAGEATGKLVGEAAEEIAALDEEALDEYFSGGEISFDTVRRLIGERKLYPVYFGSALKNTGITELMDGIEGLSCEQVYEESFGARVFKISRDDKKSRLSFMKITGGRLSVRQELLLDEKISQIRVYNGLKYTTKEYAEAGDIIAVTGLEGTYPGQALGYEKEDYLPVLTPLLIYRIVLPGDTPKEVFLPMIREIADEEPLLQVEQDTDSGDIMVSVMGEVQLEILERQLRERFGINVSFDSGRILFKETIRSAVYGVGHFEPLRHYAAVHLLLRPLPAGEGIVIDSELSLNELAASYQNEIISSLRGAFHRGRLRGVIAGLPVTDVRITLVAGRISLKHTEGGDLREAAIRAFRAALMSGEAEGNSVILEPYEKFKIRINEKFIGRVMNDISEMGGRSELVSSEEGNAELAGLAPLRFVRNYQGELNSFSGGSGRISVLEELYLPCSDQAAVREDSALINTSYDPERDRRCPVGSVFCANGAGYYVSWEDAFEKAHVEKKIRDYSELEWLYGRSASSGAADIENTALSRTAGKRSNLADELYDRAIGVDEIDSILDKAMSGNRRKDPLVKRKYHYSRKKDIGLSGRSSGGGSGSGSTHANAKKKQNYLLVDGYNIIHKWRELKILVEDNMSGARGRLLDIMSNYQAIRGMEVIVVFDAYNVPGNESRIDKYHNINVVYTKQAETADQYIARFTNENTADMNITVATSDGLIQLIIRGAGAYLLSATDLEAEIERANEELREKYDL